MAFFNYTIDDVTNAVASSIQGFDNTVTSISNLMSINLKGTGGSNDAWSSIWTATNDVSTGIGAVSICLAVIYTYVAITREGISLKGDFKKILTVLLRLVIAKGLIDSATNFMFWIYSIGAKVTTIVTSKMTGEGNASLKAMFKGDELAHGFGITANSSGFDCFIATQYARIFGFFLWGLGIALIIIAVSRIFKVYLQIMFSSLSFAKLPLEGYNGIKDNISNFFALSIQGAVMIGAIGIYKLCVAHSDVISKIYTDSMFGSFGLIIILSISLVIVIFQSESIAKKFA